VNLERCTVSYNRGWGIYGNYYPSPRLAASVVARNAKGGIHLSGYESEASATGCVVTDNGKWAVYNKCTTELDFRGNYWGERQTRWLQKHGMPADFPTVFDGHDERAAGKVRIADFLTEPPDPCGAGLQRLRGKRLVPADLQRGRKRWPPR